MGKLIKLALKQNICAQHAFAPSAKNIYSCLDS